MNACEWTNIFWWVFLNEHFWMSVFGWTFLRGSRLNEYFWTMVQRTFLTCARHPILNRATSMQRPTLHHPAMARPQRSLIRNTKKPASSFCIPASRCSTPLSRSPKITIWSWSDHDTPSTNHHTGLDHNSQKLQRARVTCIFIENAIANLCRIIPPPWWSEPSPNIQNTNHHTSMVHSQANILVSAPNPLNPIPPHLNPEFPRQFGTSWHHRLLFGSSRYSPDN